MIGERMDDHERIGAGLSTAELDLRLRYDVRQAVRWNGRPSLCSSISA